MSVIIRLQNLPWSANALDIRNFFRGLAIPEGGVHIVGGEMGDAFIAFSSDEDARQAMMLDGGKIKEVQVRLLLSSRTQMQKVIEVARQTSLSYTSALTTSTPINNTQAPPPPVIVQPPIITSSLSGMLSQQLLTKQPTDVSSLLTKNASILSQQNQIRQQSPIFGLNTPLHNDSSNDTKDSFKRDVYDKKRENDRRRSRSRSRDRRRSRSRDRISTRRRRNRSRSRSRSRDRYRSRRYRSSSRERSRERRDKINDKDKNNDVIFMTSNKIDTTNTVNSNKFNTGIWNTNTTNFNNSNLSQLIHNKTLIEAQQKSVGLNEGALNNIVQGNDTRNLQTFQIENRIQEQYTPAFGTNVQSLTTNLQTQSSMAQVFSSNLYGSNLNQDNLLTNIAPRIEGRCVKISNMDVVTGYGDIRRFFHGLLINTNGIKMINDKLGRRTGVAYIRFVRNESKKMAIERSGLDIRGKRVDVSSISEDEFDIATDSYKPSFNKSQYRSGRYHDDDDDDDDDYSDDDHSDRSRNRDRGGRDYDRNRDYDRGRRNYGRDRRYSSDSKNDDDDDDLQIISNSSSEESKNKEFSVLTIKDIPSFTREQDIIKMFSNYTLFHILLCKNVDGTKTNQAYAKFHRLEDAKAALEDKNHHMIAYKNVTVESVDDEIYERAKKEFDVDIQLDTKPTRTDTNNKVVVEEKEPDPVQKEEEIIQETNVQESQESEVKTTFDNSNDVTFDSRKSNSNKGNNNVPADNKSDRVSRWSQENTTSEQSETNSFVRADPRLNRNRNINNDNRIMDPRLRGNNQMDRNISNEDDSMNSRCSEETNNKKTYFVSISNLGLRTTERDIFNFFAEADVIPVRVHLNCDSDGFTENECICEFGSIDDAQKALTKNNSYLGMNTVRIQFILGDPTTNRLSENNAQDFNREQDTPRQPNMNFNRDLYNNFNNRQGINNSGLRGLEAVFPFYNNNLNSNGNNNLNSNNSFNTLANNISNLTNLAAATNNIRPLLENISFLKCNTNNMQGSSDNQGINDFGPPSHIVSLENVPYRAGVDDILDFFDGFQLNKQNVMRRYNDNGTPTGDARVCFNSAMEARHAVESKKYGKIFNRTIYLNLLEDL